MKWWLLCMGLCAWGGIAHAAGRSPSTEQQLIGVGELLVALGCSGIARTCLMQARFYREEVLRVRPLALRGHQNDTHLRSLLELEESVHVWERNTLVAALLTVSFASKGARDLGIF